MMGADNFIHQYSPGTRPTTLLLLHGTGGDENDLLPIGRSLAPGFSLLSPRGRVLENGAPRFFRRLAPGVFDLEDIKVRATELAAFVGEAANRYGFDASRVHAVGYSNGANIAAALMLLHPSVLAGAVMLRPMPVLQPDAAPVLTGKPVMILAGENDSMTRPELTTQLAKTLSAYGALVEVRWIDAGHDLTPYDFQNIKDYVAEIKG
jgi:phospholipase/carboxylesterase